MARFLSKAFHLSLSLPAKAPSFAFNCRYLSSKPQFLEIDLASCSSSTSSEVDGDDLISMMEKIVHRVNLRNSTPDWLPFRPGSSFWVPPVNRSLYSTDLDHKLVDSLTEEEFLAVLSSRGWPSPFCFISDNASEEANMQMKVIVGGREITIQMQHMVDEDEHMDMVMESNAEEE